MRSLVTTMGFVILLLPAAVHATDEPDELLPGFFARLRRPQNPALASEVRLRCRGAGDLALPGAANDPTVDGGTLRVLDTNGIGGDQTFALPALRWTGATNEYVYFDPFGVDGACRFVRVRQSGASRGLFARCRGTAADPIVLVPPFSGDIGVVLRLGDDSKRYCCTFGGSILRNTSKLDLRKLAPAPSACAAPPCCNPERITLTTGPGTLRVAGFSWPIPGGGTIVVDSATASGQPACEHAVTIPAGGFQLPGFDLPERGFCGQIVSLGCESGAGAGAGLLWDGRGAAGAAMTAVDTLADTSDGACNPSGQTCSTGAGGAGANTLGDVLATFGASSDAGLRGRLDVKLMIAWWLDTCSGPGCCATATFNPSDGDEDLVPNFLVATFTTGVATAAFGPLDGDGCHRVGSGFGAASPDGPASVAGFPAAGPCCTVGQSLQLVAAGTVFSGGEDGVLDLDYDLGVRLEIPATVSSCGLPAAGSCTVTTDPCLQ